MKLKSLYTEIYLKFHLTFHTNKIVKRDISYKIFDNTYTSIDKNKNFGIFKNVLSADVFGKIFDVDTK